MFWLCIHLLNFHLPLHCAIDNLQKKVFVNSPKKSLNRQKQYKNWETKYLFSSPNTQEQNALVSTVLPQGLCEALWIKTKTHRQARSTGAFLQVYCLDYSTYTHRNQWTPKSLTVAFSINFGGRPTLPVGIHMAKFTKSQIPEYFKILLPTVLKALWQICEFDSDKQTTTSTLLYFIFVVFYNVSRFARAIQPMGCVNFLL